MEEDYSDLMSLKLRPRRDVDITTHDFKLSKYHSQGNSDSNTRYTERFKTITTHEASTKSSIDLRY